MPWVDIGVCVIVLIFGIVGYFRGFLKTLLGFFSVLVTFVLAVLLAKLVCGLLETWFGMTTGLSNWVFPTIENECSDGVLSGVMLIFAQLLGISKTYDIEDPAVVSSPEFMNAFAHSLGNILAMVITVVALFIILRILVALLGKLFEKITNSSKIVGSVDKGLGFALGMLKACLSIILLFGMIYLISPMITPLADLVTSLKPANPISQFVYDLSCDVMDKVIIPWFNK